MELIQVRMLEQEESVRRNFWQDSGWRRLRMERGQLVSAE